MSTAINQYLIYGFKMSYDEMKDLLVTNLGSKEQYEQFSDDYYENGYKREITSKNGFNLIMDGMSGEYAYFGIVLQKTKNYEYMDSFTLEKPSLKIRKQLNSFENINWFSEKDLKPQLYFVTHYH